MAEHPENQRHAARGCVSLKNSIVFVNESYLSSRKLDKRAYDLCTQDLISPIERYERVRRQYAGVYRLDHPMCLRERAPDLDTFCVASTAQVIDQDASIQGADVHSNIAYESQMYCNPNDEHKDAAKSAHMAKSITHVVRDKPYYLMDGIVIDDKTHRAGASGLLIPAARLAPELLGIDTADDSKSDAQELDLDDRDLEPQLVQPGVVFCRSMNILSSDDTDAACAARVAVLSERHVIVAMLAAEPRFAGISRVYSFAWPASADDKGSHRVVVMQRKVYRELLYHARFLTKHLCNHLVPIGNVTLTVKAIQVSKNSPKREDVQMEVLADYVRITGCPDLLYREGDASGLFTAQKAELYMCASVPSALTGVHIRRAEDAFDLFTMQNTFAKGILAARKARGPARASDTNNGSTDINTTTTTTTVEAAVIEYILEKEQAAAAEAKPSAKK